MLLSIGLMSGTSMDGIDAALICTDGEMMVQELTSLSMKYTDNTKFLLKAAEKSVNKAKGNLKLAELNYLQDLFAYLHLEIGLDKQDVSQKINELAVFLYTDGALSLEKVIEHSTKLHAEVVLNLLQKSGKHPAEIGVIGYHGQTLYHNPTLGISIQIGHGQLLANLVKINVVCDFRENDLNNGGQGAPFAPIYHQVLAARDNLLPLVVVNCGGIANLSIILDSNPDNLLGFDSGPGNGLIDAFVRIRTNGKLQMDVNGQLGQTGEANTQILESLFAKSCLIDERNYFLMSHPKSLEIRDCELISELDSLSIEDGCATLEAFTAEMIVRSLDLINIGSIPKNWLLAGGGWYNPVIKQYLQKSLNNKFSQKIQLKTVTEIGWNNESLEAQIFAYLAVRSLHGKPLSFPGTTGVSRPISGGILFHTSLVVY